MEWKVHGLVIALEVEGVQPVPPTLRDRVPGVLQLVPIGCWEGEHSTTVVVDLPWFRGHFIVDSWNEEQNLEKQE